MPYKSSQNIPWHRVMPVQIDVARIGHIPVHVDASCTDWCMLDGRNHNDLYLEWRLLQIHALPKTQMQVSDLALTLVPK